MHLSSLAIFYNPFRRQKTSCFLLKNLPRKKEKDLVKVSNLDSQTSPFFIELKLKSFFSTYVSCLNSITLNVEVKVQYHSK